MGSASASGRWGLHEERGSAVVELAIVAPLFVLLLFWAVYFTELSILRIRQQEAARFLTWEYASLSLSDIDSGRHGAVSEDARAKAHERTLQRYQNLEGHNLATRGSTWIASATLRGIESKFVSLGEQEMEPLGDEILGDVERSVRIGSSQPLPPLSTLLRGMEGALLPLLSRFRFHTERVGVETTTQVEVENRLIPELPSIFPSRLKRVMLSGASMHLETDSWEVGDGGDVGIASMNHPFTLQVDRIALLGVGDAIRSKGKPLGALVDLLPLSLSARVVSQRYGEPSLDDSRLGCDGNLLASTGKWKNGPKVQTQADKMSPAKCFDTLPMEANGVGAGYRKDPSFLQFEKRGEGYLGCSVAGDLDGDCDA